MRIATHSAAWAAFLIVSVAATAAHAQTSNAGGDPPASISLIPLRIMLEKGIITQAEYDSALRDTADSNGLKAAETSSLVVGKWSAALYGFGEADYMGDSTQSYNDLAGAAQVAHPGAYAAGHPRTQFSVRNSRVGFRFRAPEYHAIRSSAVLELDFLGDWASPSYTGSSGQPTENQFFASPTPRVRHAYLKIETPIVDVLFGQTWHLFGWQSTYQPNTVQMQGIPGELYARTPQLRLSKTFSGRDVTFEVAIGAMRPPQRDSGLPEGEAGLRLAFNNWTATQTIGATGTTVSPASIALTGDIRGFAVANYPGGGTVAAPALRSTYDVAKMGGAVAVDAFIPVIPASTEHMGNSLALLGEFVYGQGIGDLFTGLTAGLTMPADVLLPTGSAPGTTPTPYNPQIDTGLVNVGSSGNMTVIKWQTIRGGVQYYLPGLDGKMWISGNYANVSSPNAPTLLTTTPATATTKATTNASAIRNALNWFDVCVMGDLTPAVRLGVEYAYSGDKYVDGQTGVNHRVQGSAFFIF